MSRDQRRVPPHNLEAEESLLGSMMLSRDGVLAGLDAVDVDDFYQPNHGKLFACIARLYGAGSAIDPVTIAAELDRQRELGAVGGRKWLLGIQGATPASANAIHYARIVGELARARRSIALGDAIVSAGYEANLDDVARLVDDAGRFLSAPLRAELGGELDELVALADADDDSPAKPWIIPGLFRVLETLILTGGEGWGKATLLRQIGVCVASGLHPFLGVPAGMPPPAPVLYVDLQEDRIDAAHELRRLRRRAGDAYGPGMFRAITRPQGMNILAARDKRWLEGIIAEHRPVLVLMGPLVRMFRGTDRQSRMSEDIVDEVTDTLDELRVRYSFALMLEGHAGNDREGEDAWRVRGSSVWRSWPAFGIGLKPVTSTPRVVEVKHWRGARHAGRPWPKNLYGDKGPWPWWPSHEDYDRLARAIGEGWIMDGVQQRELGEDEPF